MTADVAGFRPVTFVSQRTPASALRCSVAGWCQARCDARQPIGSARVNAPWINSGLPVSSNSASRLRPALVAWGSQQVRNSVRALGDGIALLLTRGAGGRHRNKEAKVFGDKNLRIRS